MRPPVTCDIPIGAEKWDWCPGSMSCDSLPANLSSTFHGTALQASFSIISSFLSCLGSLLIVYSYYKWKDIRTGSRGIITFLAIADFFTAFGYIIGSTNYIVHLGDTPNTLSCEEFTTLCIIQSFITSWSSLSSFLWTTALAIYLYCTVVQSRIVLASKLIPYFHVICWGFPILICLPLLVTEKLGYSPYAAATWCYIYEPTTTSDNGLSAVTVGWILIGGKLWEILSYFAVITLYIAIKWHIRKQTKLGEAEDILNPGLVNVVRRADRKLTFIPIVFVLLRIWGTLQFFYSLGVSNHITCACTSPEISIGFQILGVFQAIGDGGQGWGNVILYVLASDKIRNRVFGRLKYYCSTEPPATKKPRQRMEREDGDRHMAIGTTKPVLVDVKKQSVTYQSVESHEPTSPIN